MRRIGRWLWGFVLILACAAPDTGRKDGARTAMQRGALDSTPTVGPEHGTDNPVIGSGWLPTQTWPAIASDGAGVSLVVWLSTDSLQAQMSQGQILAARVAADGTVLDPGGVSLGAVTSYPEPAPMTVSFGPGGFLVAWQTGSNVHARRVSSTGAVLDATDIVIVTSSVISGNIQPTPPAVASDGTNWLVAWRDWRAGDSSGIYAARVSADGAVLDPDGIAVSTSVPATGSPDVGYDGTNFFVAWPDTRAGAPDGAAVVGARVTPEGTVLDAGGILLATETESKSYANEPNVAFDGNDWLVAFRTQLTDSKGYGIHGVRVSRTGAVIDTDSILLASGVHPVGRARVTYDGTHWFVVYLRETDGATLGTTVSSAGVVDTTTIQIAQGPFPPVEPRVAADGTQVVVVTAGTDANVRVSRVDSSPSLLDSPGFQIAPRANNQQAPAAASNGTATLVAWEDQRVPGASGSVVYGTRVGANGVALDANGIAITTSNETPADLAVGSDGRNWLVAWTAPPAGASTLMAALVGADVGLLASDLLVSPFGRAAGQPAIGFDGTEWLVVYAELGAQGAGIYGTRVSTSGEVLDADSFVISTSPGGFYRPRLAFNGTNWLVVWELYFPPSDIHQPGQVHLYGRVVSREGAVLSGSDIPIAVGADAQVPAVASDGNQWFVAWADGRENLRQLYGARLDQNGSLLDPGGVLLASQSYVDRPSVARYGSNWLVAWQAPAAVDTDIYGQLVASDASLVGGAFVLSDSPGAQSAPILTPGSGGELLLSYVTTAHQAPTRVWDRVLCGAASDVNCHDTGVGGNAGGAGQVGATGGIGPTTGGVGGVAAVGATSGGAAGDSEAGGAASDDGGVSCEVGGGGGYVEGAAGEVASAAGGTRSGASGGGQTSAGGSGKMATSGAGGRSGIGGSSGDVTASSGRGAGGSSHAGGKARAGASGAGSPSGEHGAVPDAGCSCAIGETQRTWGWFGQMASLLVLVQARRSRRRRLGLRHS